jgi:hypothetical protein
MPETLELTVTDWFDDWHSNRIYASYFTAGSKQYLYLCIYVYRSRDWATQLRTETDSVSETLCSLIFRKPEDGQSKKNPVIPRVIHHGQNPLESTCVCMYVCACVRADTETDWGIRLLWMGGQANGDKDMCVVIYRLLSPKFKKEN